MRAARERRWKQRDRVPPRQAALSMLLTVMRWVSLKRSSQYWRRSEDFPTFVLPITMYFNISAAGLLNCMSNRFAYLFYGFTTQLGLNSHGMSTVGGK